MRRSMQPAGRRGRCSRGASAGLFRGAPHLASLAAAGMLHGVKGMLHAQPSRRPPHSARAPSRTHAPPVSPRLRLRPRQKTGPDHTSVPSSSTCLASRNERSQATASRAPALRRNTNARPCRRQAPREPAAAAGSHWWDCRGRARRVGGRTGESRRHMLPATRRRPRRRRPDAAQRRHAPPTCACVTAERGMVGRGTSSCPAASCSVLLLPCWEPARPTPRRPLLPLRPWAVVRSSSSRQALPAHRLSSSVTQPLGSRRRAPGGSCGALCECEVGGGGAER